eukprot:598616-Hanusia_phi.AAC.3
MAEGAEAGQVGAQELLEDRRILVRDDGEAEGTRAKLRASQNRRWSRRDGTGRERRRSEAREEKRRGRRGEEGGEEERRQGETICDMIVAASCDFTAAASSSHGILAGNFPEGCES